MGYLLPVRRTILVMLSALLPALAGLALMPPGHAAPDTFSRVWDRGPGGERMVALGDSFASGPGIAPQRPEGCSRSERNFPSLVAGVLDRAPGGLNAYTDASCGGARSVDLFSAQSLPGGRTNSPQLEALDADTTLVTFGTLGGNDIGLVQLATSCFSTDCVPAAGTDPYAERFRTLETQLSRGIAQARSRAPRARILVIGYGTYLPPRGCVATFGGALDAEEFTYVQSQIDRMSDTLERVATGPDVDFVDMRDIPGSVDRTACAEPRRQWIRALETYGDGAVLHPSACGMDAMAQHLVRTLQGLRGEPQTPFDDSCVSAGPAQQPTPTPSATPTPTPTTTPTQVPAPSPNRAARRVQLRAEAKSLTLRPSCSNARARVQVRGTTERLARVRFSVGPKKVGVDRTGPFRVSLRAAKLPARGQLRAKVVLRDGDLRVVRNLRRARPACLR